MAYEELKSSGVTGTTPENILFGAGTIHRGLQYTEGKWNFAESLIGATSGGTKLTIKPEFKDIEVDGALVKTRGLVVKVGETAQLETNFAETTPETLKMQLIANEAAATSADGYNEITSKPRIETGDYIENLGYVGKKLDGTPVIVIFDYALCTSGLEVEGKNKENSVSKATFECYAETDGDLETLPYHIYYPTPATAAAAASEPEQTEAE